MNQPPSDAAPRPISVLVLAALGVVFGDIGTSPLYAVRECFFGVHAIAIDRDNILGVASLIVWALLLTISLKYVFYLMRADNRGEGGDIALMALASRKRADLSARALTIVSVLGIAGAALLYADGVITPAISVMSAVEGLKVAAPALEPMVLPITVAVLTILFLLQHHGTARIGAVFGPVILVWFVVIGFLGVRSILLAPDVLHAINPVYAFRFLVHEGYHAFVVLGSVFLVMTGAEALYADMGHFGRIPIARAWFMVALPGLLLNYLGQGALLLRVGGEATNPFYELVPHGGLYPMIVLATLTTVIASQAVITSAFSLTRQAVQLGYLPRIEILHTSSEHMGQIFVPRINLALLIVTIAVVLSFQSSSKLAVAYGLCVSLTMVISTVLMCVVSRRVWKWPLFLCVFVTGAFLVVDLAFLIANGLKIASGGWVPLFIGSILMTVMLTWSRGRRLLSDRLKDKSMPISEFLETIAEQKPHRVEGTALFLTGDARGTPLPLIHNLHHNKVLHEKVVLVTILTEQVPTVPLEDRVTVEDLGQQMYRVIAYFGFMDSPSIQSVLEGCRNAGLEFDFEAVTFFIGRETVLAANLPAGMSIWRERLFAFMSRNAQRATAFYKIPSKQVFEIGLQVEL